VPTRPLIGLTPAVEIRDGRTIVRVNATYLEMLVAAGGAPVVLTPDPSLADEFVDRLDGVVLTGGPDIDTRPFGVPLHERSEPMDPRRQAFDFAMLAALDRRRERAALGICLGMQEMGVHAGCPLIQHLGDALPDAERHGNDNTHAVRSRFGDGPVASWHHQALGDAGRFEIAARSDDGLIEGIRDPERPFYVGVQWHPERTTDPILGLGVMRALVEAAGR
jgi:putative glutamine amidotransferase